MQQRALSEVNIDHLGSSDGPPWYGVESDQTSLVRLRQLLRLRLKRSNASRMHGRMNHSTGAPVLMPALNVGATDGPA